MTAPVVDPPDVAIHGADSVDLGDADPVRVSPFAVRSPVDREVTRLEPLVVAHPVLTGLDSPEPRLTDDEGPVHSPRDGVELLPELPELLLELVELPESPPPELDPPLEPELVVVDPAFLGTACAAATDGTARARTATAHRMLRAMSGAPRTPTYGSQRVTKQL